MEQYHQVKGPEPQGKEGGSQASTSNNRKLTVLNVIDEGNVQISKTEKAKKGVSQQAAVVHLSAKDSPAHEEFPLDIRQARFPVDQIQTIQLIINFAYVLHL